MNRIARSLKTVALPLALAVSLAAAPTLALASNRVVSSTMPETNGIIITLNKSVSRIPQSDIETNASSPSSDTGVVRNLEEAGLTIEETHTSPGGNTVLVAEPENGMSDAEALEQASATKGVADVQYNFVYHLIDFIDDGNTQISTQNEISLQATSSVNDPIAKISSPDNRFNPSANQYWAYATHLNDAWSHVATDHTATVVTMDSGAHLDHEDLRDNVLADLAWDVTLDAPLKDCPVQDSKSDSHGTMIAGVIAAAANNGKGIAGSSYNANVLPIKVVSNTGEIESIYLTEAFDYLFGLIDAGKVSNVRAINMSLGAYGELLGEDKGLHARIQKALNEYGILTVCSGGNSSGSSTPRQDPMYPSDFEECISVTSLDADGTNTYLSDFNMAKDISAPGERIYTTGPNNEYKQASGTSLSSPMVAGSIALLYAAEPTATTDDIREALYRSADPIADPVNDRSKTSGSHGALNTDAALDAIHDIVESKPEPVLLPFSDVSSTEWYYDAIAFVYKNNIMKGYGGTSLFGPNDQLLREEAAQLLYNYLGNGEQAPAAPQADVNQNDYYTAAVNWAVSTGIMTGYKEPDGTSVRFGIGEALTREELATVLARYAAKTGDSTDSSIFESMPDHALASPWARDSLIWAVNQGVLNGALRPDGTRYLNPNIICTRAEVATIIKNSVEKGLL